MNQILNGDATLKEQQNADPSATLLYGAPEGDSRIAPTTFRGWPVLEQLPTKGAEADIYIVQAGQDRRILKLYRHRLEPKLEVLNRIAELSRIHSRHFVIFFEAGFDERTGRWYELQEYMPLGSLRDISQTAKRDTAFIRELAFQLSEAIHCLHENEIIHCDIKPPNVLVRSLDPPDLVLTDFGISSILAADASNKMTNLKGTPMYWAPEAFSRMIGRPCDWWGLGMIVLELLAGEHPFEGMTDSQIIRELTIGNVEIPDSLDPEWSLLVKGLLTKNDAKRWGYDEVVKWLAGARDIPVYYEDSRTQPSLDGAQSNLFAFRFEGNDYFRTEDLARAFAESEAAWTTASAYLRFIRQWFEKNIMIDEAEKLGKDIASVGAERALFRFVHSNASLPFCLLGKRLDAEALSIYLGRAAQGKASDAEKNIVEMLGNGQIVELYDEYIELSGKERDPYLNNLLLSMDKKTLSQQLECLEATKNPSSYLWPEEVSVGACSSGEEILTAIIKMRTTPLRRDDFEIARNEFVLPEELLSMLGGVSTYAESAGLFADWKAKGLLLPRETDSSNQFGRLRLDEYARVARVRCFGHTSTMLRRIDVILQELPSFLNIETLQGVTERLHKLKDMKITPVDSVFISRVANLLQQLKTSRPDLTDLYHSRSGSRAPAISYVKDDRPMIRGRIASACVAYLNKITHETNEPDSESEHELFEQQVCLETVNDPSSFLWPEDISLGNGTEEEISVAVTKIRTQPLRRDDIEALKSDFVLPAELLSMLSRASTYAEGTKLFTDWKTAGLLLPREPYFCDQYERMSLHEYARAARVRFFGHTHAVMENIDFLISAFQALPHLKTLDPMTWSSVPWRITERLRKLKEVKITTEDTIFMSNITDLLKRRNSIASGKFGRYCAAGVGGGLAFWLARLIMSMVFGEVFVDVSLERLFLLGFFPLTLGAIAGFCLHTWMESRAFSAVEGQIYSACNAYLSN